MPKVITVNTMKGGQAKSTLVLNLYHYLVQEGYEVGVIDADPQASVKETLERYQDEIPVIGREQIEDWQDVSQIKQGDFILVDTAPIRDTEEALAVYAISALFSCP